MAFEGSPNRSTGSITPSFGKRSPGPSYGLRVAATDNSSPDSEDEATVIRWSPLVVPLLALLPTLAVYFIVWGALVPR